MIHTIKNWYQDKVAVCEAVEVEQAKLRIAVGIVIFGFCIFNYFGHNLNEAELVVFKINLIFQVLAFSLFYTILSNKLRPIQRRIIGAWVDIGTATVFMSMTEDIGVALVIIYLWVTFGNGFRYGKKYLYHSQVLSFVGFLITMQFSLYWKQHETVGYSLLAMLTILPLYVAKLIDRLQDSLQKQEIERKKAQEASLAKSRFVANISHEIRTPLNGIIGIGNLLKTTPLNPDQQDLIKTLDSSSRLLLSLLNNVLDLTKIEEKKVELHSNTFSLQELVSDTTEIFRNTAANKAVLIQSNSPNLDYQLNGDVSILRQVLANLVGNAVKFTETGSVTLSSSLVSDTATNATIRFEVIDTGVGIATEKLSKVFESFTQADEETTRKFGGSGLGLTIAKQLVSIMGGDLRLESNIGQGSRFWFDIKLEKELAFTSAPETTSSATLNAPIQLPQNVQTESRLNILVCEDEATNQKILARILSMPGHQVSIVASSDEMLDQLESNSFDLVITDRNMVGMSGTEALKLYRFIKPEDKKTKFILFTADATAEAKQEATDASFDGFLTKPIDMRLLFEAMQNILQLPENTALAWLNICTAQQNQPTPIATAPDINNTNDELSAILDASVLQSLESIAHGSHQFMENLLGNYLADSVKIVYKIEEAIKQKHFGELGDLCHALKGNSYSVGAVRFAETTEIISKLQSTTPSTEALDLLDKHNREFSALTSHIDSYLRQTRAAA